MKKVIHLICIFMSLLFITALPSCTENAKDPGASAKEEPLVVHSRLRSDPDILNPMLSSKGYSIQIFDMIFPTMIHFDPNTNKIAPMLATSRPSMEPITEGPYKGGATFTYEIHKEAVWDNGNPVLASDYLFSLKALFTPEVKSHVYRGILNFIKDVKIDPENPKRFTVYTDRIFRAETNSGFYVYPEHAYDSTGIMRKYELLDLTDPSRLKKIEADPELKTFADRFNSYGTPGTLIESCGPYRVVEWEVGRHVILEKKKNWWGDKLADKYPLLRAYPDEIIFKPIPDEAAAITAMKDGQLDVMGAMSSSAYLEFKDSKMAPSFNFHNPEKLAYMYIALNKKRPHLADKKVRRALAHLLDIEEIIETVQRGMAVPTVGPFPTNAPYYNKTLQPIAFDSEKAKTLLSEAGWKDSDKDGTLDKVIKGKKTPLKITVLLTSSPISNNIVNIIKEDARKIGVDISVEVLPYNQLMNERVAKRDFDAFASASMFDLDLFDPTQGWHTSSNTPNGHNRCGFGNKETDAIIDEIRSTNDEKRRNQLYLQLQDIIYDDQPYLFLYTPQDRIVISKKLKNAKTTLRSPGYLENHFR